METPASNSVAFEAEGGHHSPPRLVVRLDIKGPNVIKGVQFEGLRVVGEPENLANKYYEAGAQEILFIDTVASLYGRNNLHSLVAKTVRKVFVPLTAGGGITSVSEARALLTAGADKVALNTPALKRPELIRELASEFGSQCVVLSIEAKRTVSGWEALMEAGREHSGRDAFEWLEEAIQLGAGEILITSVDQDGTGAGFDLNLIAEVCRTSDVPVIAGGGFGRLQDLGDLLGVAFPEAIAVGRSLHLGQVNCAELREFLGTAGGK